MKKFLLLVLTVFVTCYAHGKQDTLRIIAIGNSFADDALIQYVWPIANADGVPMICANMYIGGCTMQQHAQNIASDAPSYVYRKNSNGEVINTSKVKLSYGLEDEPWDIVMLQTGQGQYGLYDNYFPYINQVMDYAKAHVKNSNLKFIMQQVWALPDNTVKTSYLAYYNNSKKNMYETIVATMNRLKNDLGIWKISPTATAIENVRKTYVLENVTRDGFHLNKYIGRYTAGCAMYETLTGRSCIGNSYKPLNISDERIDIAQKAAHAAVQNPNQPTNLHIDVAKPNYDENLIPKYELPDALTMSNGTKVKNKQQWLERRKELLDLFEKEMYGKAPGKPSQMRFELLSENREALNGKATMKQVAIYFTPQQKNPVLLLAYSPNGKKPCPSFLGINFKGNHAVCNDTSIIIPKELKHYGIYDTMKRGASQLRWPLEEIIDRGYGVVTFYRGDIDPDFDDGFANGIHPLFYKKDQIYPEADEWGTIAAWAWGLQRALDYLETDKDFDAHKVTVFGHSRLGKTALWAGVCDERFAAVISNCSGCCGAALSRRKIGETIETMNRHFNHWFCGNFKKYNNKEELLPFDQHELLSLVAPRPLYVASATEDRWADPAGEKQSAIEASRVYKLFGKKGIEDGTIGYHIRQGKHDILLEDWNHYMDFTDKYVK